MINIDDRLYNAVDMSEYWLLSHIVRRLNKQMYCFPSNKTLMMDTGWAIDKLQKVKKSLVDKGLISVDSRFNETDRQSTNFYRVETDLIGVFVDGKRLSYPPIKTVWHTDENSTREGVEKPTTEVLTKDEVLIHEESNDSSSKKPVLAQAKSETKTKKEGGGPVYVSCVEHWLKVVHPGWGFKAVDGKAMKGIIAQMVQYSNMKQLKDGDSVKYPSDEQLINFFKHFCKSLPEFYKSQTLTVLNTKFDSIIETIKRSDGKGKQPVNWNNPKDTSAIIRNLR